MSSDDPSISTTSNNRGGGGGSKSPQTRITDFKSFHTGLQSRIEQQYYRVLSQTEVLTPCMVKIEELLFGSRSRKAPKMASYYRHWEDELYRAAVSLVLGNLEDYSQMLSRKNPASFHVTAILYANETGLDPDAASIVERCLEVAKKILAGTKRMVRRYRYLNYFSRPALLNRSAFLQISSFIW